VYGRRGGESRKWENVKGWAQGTGGIMLALAKAAKESGKKE
jgi:hypothetical protein